MLTLRTPAKVNIGLWVERRRPDGYHELRSLFFPVSLFDRLSFEAREQGGIELSCEIPHVPSDSKNLVWRAADLYFTYTGVRSGIRVDLKKGIPVGHGLGGGSSDAAATLLGLDRLFNTRLSRDELHSLAIELGMDCPFFLDPRPCLVTGRGERMEPLNVPSFDLVIYSPGFGISTRWAYKQLKRLTNGKNPCKLLAKALRERRYHEASQWLYNSFEEVVYKRCPELERMVGWFVSNGAWFAGLSGSGSALFAAVGPDVEVSLPAGVRGRLFCVRTLEHWGVV